MFGKHVNYVAILSMCWGILLTSIAFVSVVLSTNDPYSGEEQLEHFSVKLICQVSILALGAIQTIFSAVLIFTSKSVKEAWTTVWICAHIVIVLGLVFFYILQTTYTSLVISSSTGSWSPVNLTTLDATVLFDFLFLTIIFISILCESPKESFPGTISSSHSTSRIESNVPTLSNHVDQNSNILLNPRNLASLQLRVPQTTFHYDEKQFVN